jgi:hypothetical protein
MKSAQNLLQDLAIALRDAQDLTKKAITFGIINGSSVEYDSYNQKLTEKLVEINAIIEQIKDCGYLADVNEYKIMNAYQKLNQRRTLWIRSKSE